ncbi:unnamed protein product [Pylaiella littoralis]
MTQGGFDKIASDNHAKLLRSLAWKLRCRNLQQSSAFKDVYSAHGGLLHINEKLRQQTLQQDKDIIILRHKLTEGLSQGKSSEALRSMQDEMQRLQVQVSDKYRSSAESASEQLRLMKELQLLQDQVKPSNERLEKLQTEHGLSMSKYAKLEEDNTLLESALASLRAETESLRNLLGTREADAVFLREGARKEREELMSRLLKDKGSMLEEMNKMNEENATLREEKKTLAAKLQQQQQQQQQPQGAPTAAQARQTATSGVVGRDNERPEAGTVPAWLSPEQPLQEGNVDRESFSTSTSSAYASSSYSLGGRNKSGAASVGFPSRCFQAIEAHSSGVNDVVFEKGGVLLATAGDDSYVKVWDSGSGRQRAALKGAAHKGIAAMIAVDIHGDLVCGGASDGSCTVWGLRTCREQARLTGHQQKVCGVAFCDAGQRLVTGSQDCSIKVWDLHRGQWDATTCAMRATSKCNAVDVSHSWKDSKGTNAVVVSGHMDGSARLWDMRSGSCAHKLQGLHTDQVTSVRFAPGRGNLLLTNSKDGTLKVVDARMYQVVACLSHPKFRTASSFSRACLSPSAAYAAAPSANGNVYVWDIARSTTGSGSSDSGAAFAAPGAGTGTPSSSSLPSSVVATVLQTHGVAASGCDWCLNMPSTLASCDSKGGLRVWG